MAAIVHSDTDVDALVRPTELINPDGAAAIVLVCEHASNFIPPELDDLGLDTDALQSHIAWDPGALNVARHMSRLLDAPLVAQQASRLIYDCNRPPETPSAVPMVSEIYRIPGNADLSDADRRERVERYYQPFRDMLAATLDRAAARRGMPALVTVHSFTPSYHGVQRRTDVGILHDDDSRLADALLEASAGDGDLLVERNQPYGPEDGVTHTLREHAQPRGLANVMLEVRNDLIADADNQLAMAERLTRWLSAALAAFARPHQAEA